MGTHCHRDPTAETLCQADSVKGSISSTDGPMDQSRPFGPFPAPIPQGELLRVGPWPWSVSQCWRFSEISWV